MFKFAIQKGHCGKTKSQIQTDCSGSNVDFERISDKYIHEALLKDTTDLRQAVIKISNISWDLTTTEVIEWLTGKAEKQSSNSRPVFKLKPSNDILVTGQIINISKRHIHIPIDRSTGKTKADMYVELLGPQDALYCIKKYNKGILKGRSVTISMSSMEELHEVHFYSINAMKCIDTDQVLSFSGTEAILNICRNYKVSRISNIFIKLNLCFINRLIFRENALNGHLNMLSAFLDWLLGIAWMRQLVKGFSIWH